MSNYERFFILIKRHSEINFAEFCRNEIFLRRVIIFCFFLRGGDRET